MASLIKDRNGQIMLLTALLIIIGVIGYTTILNAMVFSANTPSTGLEVSKKDISEFRKLTESEIFNAALFSKINTTGNGQKTLPQVQNDFMNFMESYIESIKTLYAARGVSVDIILNNVTFNVTNSTTMKLKYFVEKNSQDFSAGSLVIPMDENQTNIMKVYGFIYNLVDDTGTGNSPLNRTRVPVWILMQNAVNGSVTDFYTKMNTSDNPSTTGVEYVTRNYSGGPFLIEIGDLKNADGTLNETLKQMILDEATNKGIIIHKLQSNFKYTKSVVLRYPPRIAIYPEGDDNTQEVMKPYYIDGEVPFTEINNIDIINDALSNYDILTIPHFDMNSLDSYGRTYNKKTKKYTDNNATALKNNVIKNIEFWVRNGGILHAECLATDSMDDAVESVPDTKNIHTWYGFIGINGSDSNLIPDGGNSPYNRSKDGRFMKLVDKNTPFNVSPFNASYTYDMSPPIPLAGLADPGTPYDPVAQADNTSGIFASELYNNGNPAGATTTSFSLHTSPSQVNPDANILAYTSYANGTPLYGDFSSHSNIKVPMLTYIEAPYDNGLVVYVAGHNLANRSFAAERLIFESFFAASMKRTETMIVSAKKINVTIKYFDGKVMVEDTLLINI